MSEPRRSRRGRLYSGLLTILIVGVVGVAASALYLTTGGHLFGMTGGVFGLQAPRDSSGDVLARAREAAWAGRFPAAVAGYDSALAAAPDRALALERARVLGWAGRHDEAAAALAAVEDPADVETTLERARYLWWADRPTEADSLLSELLARRPGLAEAAELQDLIRPSIEPSARVAERWVRDRPDDPFSHLWLARALVAEGRRAPALAHYRAAFGGAGSAEPEVLLEAAGVALGLDSLRFAGETLARYLNDVDPGDTTTRLRLARAYAWSGRYDRAEAEYRRVLAADPDPAVRRELASTLAAAGRHDAALDELARVLAGGEERRDLLERARVLALADRYGEAADALERAGTSGDAELELRRARYLWWAGRLPEADAALSGILERSPGSADMRSLRAEVRRGIDPSVDVARAWLARDDTPENRLRLAGALVEAERYAESLEHYRAALAAAPDREVLVAMSEAAEAADSVALATRLVERYLAGTTRDEPEQRLRLARLYAWAERPEESAGAYRRYLAVRPDDAGARYERAQQLAARDSTHWAEARAELERAVASDSLDARPHRLLGDLARWEGDPAAALDHYRRAAALDPGLEGLDEGVRRATAMAEAEEAPRDATIVAWAVDVDGFSDSEGFDWLASRARYHWLLRGATLSATVGQGYSGGRSLVGAEQDALGFDIAFGARVALAPRWHALAEAGATRFQDVDPFPTWGAGLEYQDASGSVTLRYQRQPGVREAATMAALQAGTTLDRVQLTALRRHGPWSGAADAQVQRFGADAGDATRFAAMARAGRAVGGGLTLGAMIRAIAADGAAPVDGDWGPLFWAPAHYIAPAVTVGYARPVGDRGWLGLRAAPGYAWIDEREGGVVRYRDGETPILEAGATVGYRVGTWSVDLSGDWGGNLAENGYDATSITLRISRSGGAP